MAGVSATPLPRKLGIKSGQRIVTIGAPANYRELLSDMPPDAVVTNRISRAARFVHLFVRSRRELARQLAALREKIDDSGIIWVSWPKKSSGVSTDLTEDVIRNEALPLGFVDVKVCAVDETWSGLKLMIRRTKRKADARR
jgi:hypothetical protein